MYDTITRKKDLLIKENVQSNYFTVLSAILCFDF